MPVILRRSPGFNPQILRVPHVMRGRATGNSAGKDSGKGSYEETIGTSQCRMSGSKGTDSTPTQERRIRSPRMRAGRSIRNAD